MNAYTLEYSGYASRDDLPVLELPIVTGRQVIGDKMVYSASIHLQLVNIIVAEHEERERKNWQIDVGDSNRNNSPSIIANLSPIGKGR